MKTELRESDDVLLGQPEFVATSWLPSADRVTAGQFRISAITSLCLVLL
jgi:hypothetical protein